MLAMSQPKGPLTGVQDGLPDGSWFVSRADGWTAACVRAQQTATLEVKYA